MSNINVPLGADISLRPELENPDWRSIASYESELAEHRDTEVQLLKALLRDQDLLEGKDELIRQQELLNQMIVSVLSLQSRTEENAEAASRLSVAASRVNAIAGLHRHLHAVDGEQTVEFGQYLDELCRDDAATSTSDRRSDQPIAVDGLALSLPTATGTPLGLIANELITNAIKHGKGQITVKLARSGEGYALSVCNAGSTLPTGFDATACTGLGLSLVSSLVAQIGGELRIDRGDDNDGTRFTVLFK